MLVIEKLKEIESINFHILKASITSNQAIM